MSTVRTSNLPVVDDVAEVLGHEDMGDGVMRTVRIAKAVLLGGEGGVAGDDGWTAVLAIESDGERRVVRVVGYVGGDGTPPATGYVGASGMVATAAEAVNIRGATGASGAGSGDMLASVYDANGDGVVDYITNATARATGGEGGQINLEKGPTSTLDGHIAIDSNLQRLRFFVAGGAALGCYIELTECAAGANSKLLHTGITTTAGLALLQAEDAAEQREALALGTIAPRNLTISTSDPTGGADGDIWLKVSA